MPPRSFARPAALCAGIASLLAPVVCPASPPAVPPVAEIPVAPLSNAPSAKKHRTHDAPPPVTPTPAPTTTVPAPALALIGDEPAPARGVPETMPAPAAPPPRVVLVDGLPTRATPARARELPEHARHGKKRGRDGRPFHPAPGIVVDVVDAQGGANAGDLQRVARSAGYWPLRRCYEEGLRRNQQLAGAVTFEVARPPAAARIVDSTLRDESVALCVLREARRIELPWGDGSDESVARVKVSLATGDEPVPAARTAPHAARLRDALEGSWPAVEQCYASELGKHPDLGGPMELRFRVSPRGEVDDVSEVDPGFADVDVTRCVLGVYRTATLPRMHGAHEASFFYPLHFEAAQNVSPAAK